MPLVVWRGLFLIADLLCVHFHAHVIEGNRPETNGES